MPQQCDGMRTEPPMSVPSSNDVKPAATAAAGPPDEPPGMRVTSHGLFVVPKSSLKLCTSPDQRGRFVLPNTMAPASRRRATAGASAAGTWSVSSTAPPVERMPAVSMASLIVIGSPCSGGSGPPSRVRASAASASARARSTASVTTALIAGSRRSMRSRYSSSRSRLVISPVADRLRLLGGGPRGPGVVQHAAMVRGRPGAPGTCCDRRRGDDRGRRGRPRSPAAHVRRKLWRRFWFTTRSAMRSPASVENR